MPWSTELANKFSRHFVRCSLINLVQTMLRPKGFWTGNVLLRHNCKLKQKTTNVRYLGRSLAPKEPFQDWLQGTQHFFFFWAGNIFCCFYIHNLKRQNWLCRWICHLYFRLICHVGLSLFRALWLCRWIANLLFRALSLAWFIDAMPRIYSCLYMTLYSKCKSQQWLIIWVGNKTLRELSGAQTTENVPLFYFTNQQHS